MDGQQRFLDRIVLLARARSNGEFVCASAAAEIHVFLQEGRLAWATASRHPLAFIAYLQEQAGIDEETLQHVVEECRRDRMPLGETLVKWGLTSLENVRGALLRQMRQTLDLLRAVRDGQALFLDRPYRHYDPQLTFDLSEVLRAEDLRSASFDGRETTAAPQGARSELARRFRTTLEGIDWVEVRGVDGIVDQDPPASTARLSRDLVGRTLLDGADFTAVRTATTSVIGVALEEQRSLWCQVSAASSFGQVVASIWALRSSSDRVTSTAPRRPESQAWSIGAADTPWAEAMAAFVSRANDVLGVVLFSEQLDAPVAGMGFAPLDRAACVETIRRRLPVLTTKLDSEGRTDPVAEEAIQSMVTGEATWCFGGTVYGPVPRTVWMFLDRRSAQGLGWAYLTLLRRSLSELPELPARALREDT